MLKNKRILLILILAVVLFFIPSICNAATIEATQTTTTSTGKNVKWSYELENESIVNLKCINISEVSGIVEIPSKIDGYTVVELGHRDGWSHYDGIFENCNGITGVTIPDTVVTIGEDAFSGCTGLKSITIPNGVTSIGNSAFSGCTGLKSITILNNVTSIGNSAFRECTGLKSITIPNNVTKIGSYAFSGCSGITSLIIPDSVTSIGAYAFKNCTGLVNITLSKNLTKIDRETFSGCKALISVVIPDSVTTIAGYDGSIYGAFEDCIKLEKVLVPDSVATIEKSAFHNCPKLTIYGNDNQASKQYAEDNNINFDYIANWDKASSGNDIAAPTVEKIYIKYSSILNYWDKNTNTHRIPTGGQIIIVVNFSEEIKGNTSPTLAIKCGVGSNINLTNGTIAGKTVIYTYTVKAGDLGLISSVSLTGGDVTDLSGNKAELSCPKMTEQYGSNNDVYANGASTVVEQENNNQTIVTLSSIAITKAPTRNTYSEGESFDKSGMVITATYSDGSKKEITNYSISPSGTLKSTDNKVYITYTENGVTKAVEQKVTVTPKLIINNNNSNNNDNNSESENNNYKDDTEKDTTIKNDSKLPQTGTTLIILTIICLIVVAVVSKFKCIKYKDI